MHRLIFTIDLHNLCNKAGIPRRRHGHPRDDPRDDVDEDVGVRVGQGRSDGGYIGIYTPPKKKSTLQILCGYNLLVVFFSLTPGQLRYRASVRLSSCFLYLLTHHNLYHPPNAVSYTHLTLPTIYSV